MYILYESYITFNYIKRFSTKLSMEKEIMRIHSQQLSSYVLRIKSIF